MPDKVSNIQNDINHRVVTFSKNGLECQINITSDKKLFDLKVVKNNKKQHTKSVTGITDSKLCKAIYSIIETV